MYHVMEYIINCITYNSLLLSANDRELERLQRVQNCAARLVLRLRKRDSISNGLERLHWLLIKKRVIFKVLTIMYKVSRGTAPVYLCELFKKHKPVYDLKSGSRMMFERDSCKSVKYGTKRLNVYGCKLWNELPLRIKMEPTLRNFKRKLKTYMFTAQHF